MTDRANRRDFMKAATMATTGVAVSCGNGATPEQSTGPGYPQNLPEPLPRGLEYVLRVRAMVEEIIDGETDTIARAAKICADAVKAGKSVWYTILGHNAPQCILETKPGRPSFLKPLNPREASVADTVGKDDVLISVRTDQCVTARKNGARAIGILMPFQPQKSQGQGIVHIDYPGPYMEDICDVCIWDRTPYTVGIMAFDQLPWHALSAHGAMDGIILGLILAGTVDRLVADGVTVEADGW